MRAFIRQRVERLTSLDPNAEFGHCRCCHGDIIIEPREKRVWHSEPPCAEWTRIMGEFDGDISVSAVIDTQKQKIVGTVTLDDEPHNLSTTQQS